MENKVLKPKIRFKGFTDTWEQRKFKNYFDERNERTGIGEMISVTISSGIKKFSELNRYDSKPDDLSKYKRVVEGDIAYNSMRMWQGASGYSPYTGILSPAYTVIKPKDGISAKFFSYQIKRPEMIHQFELNSQGLTKDTLNLKFPAFSEIETTAPIKVNEQNKIAKLLEKVDNLITLHQSKYDKLVNVKKALLEKMFPKDGKNVPEIRFKGFTDTWEQRKVGEFGELITGTTPSTSDVNNYNGDYLFVSPADIQGNRFVKNTITTLSEKGFCKCRRLKADSVLFVSIGSTIGKVAQIKEIAVTNQQINAIIPNEKYNPNFVYSLLENKAEDIKKQASAQAVPIINKTTFGEIECFVTTSKEEQTKISKILLNIDNLITLHQHKLEKLKNMKKSLLNKMFI